MSDIEIIKNDSGLKLDYDEISPITNNKCVIVEGESASGEEHRMCMESGYVTRTSLGMNTPAIEKYELACSELMIKLRLIDNNLGTVWYPTFLQMPGIIMYVEGKGKSPSDYNWSIAKIVPIVGEERLKYPIVGKEDEYHTTRLDVDNAVKYSGYDFETALESFYEFKKHMEDED